MNKNILALDGDQILFDWVGGFISFAISRGYVLDINSKFDTYNMSPWFTNMDNETFIKLIGQYNAVEHPSLYPYLRDGKVLHQLQQKYELCVITSYASCAESRRRRMGILNSLDISNIFLLDIGESKYETLMEIGGKNGENIFVDDRLEHMQEGLDAGWNVRTIRYPFNKGMLRVGYMNSLEELL